MVGFKKQRIVLGTILGMAILGIVWHSVRRERRKELAQEARHNVYIFADIEITHWHNFNGTYLPIPMSTVEIPRATCVKEADLLKDFRETMKSLKRELKPSSSSKGEPCFRYRYQVIVCPGTQECERWRQKDEKTYAIIRAEGDLDGNGVSSLFEAQCHKVSETEIQCVDGIYSERDLE